MKKIDLGQSLQILGNLGVIVGILLLVYELNQNRNMMAAQIRNSISETSATRLHDEARDSRLIDLNLRAFAGEQLTLIQQEQFRLNWMANFRG